MREHVERQVSPRATQQQAVPCAARPSTGFVHLDGPCRCFAGGPPPEFARSMTVVPFPIAYARSQAS